MFGRPASHGCPTATSLLQTLAQMASVPFLVHLHTCDSVFSPIQSPACVLGTPASVSGKHRRNSFPVLLSHSCSVRALAEVERQQQSEAHRKRQAAAVVGFVCSTTP
jgi:hypothetical protein